MGFQSDILQCEPIGAVARLTMNRPAARNSLSMEMLGQLHTAITALGADSTVHVVILAANGPAFCAGHDLKELTAARASEDAGRAFLRRPWPRTRA